MAELGTNLTQGSPPEIGDEVQQPPEKFSWPLHDALLADLRTKIDLVPQASPHAILITTKSVGSLIRSPTEATVTMPPDKQKGKKEDGEKDKPVRILLHLSASDLVIRMQYTGRAFIPSGNLQANIPASITSKVHAGTILGELGSGPINIIQLEVARAPNNLETPFDKMEKLDPVPFFPDIDKIKKRSKTS